MTTYERLEFLAFRTEWRARSGTPRGNFHALDNAYLAWKQTGICCGTPWEYDGTGREQDEPTLANLFASKG